MVDEGGARRLCGLLAKQHRAQAFAAVVLGAGTPADIAAATDLDESQAALALRQLTSGGLLRTGDTGRFEPSLRRLRDAAAGREQDPAAGEPDAARAAVLRHFLDADGRLREIPSGPANRRAVLEHIAGRFEIGVTYPERVVTLRLREFHADHAALRRYLVENELLERRDGVYWRSGGPTEV